MSNEYDRTDVAWARGHEATNIKDPKSKRAFIARQGNEEARERMDTFKPVPRSGSSFDQIARESIDNWDESRASRRSRRSR